MKWIVAIAVAGLVVLTAQAQRRTNGVEVGADAPTFTLKLLHSDGAFRLESNFGKRPTVLIFGSYT